MLAGDGEKDDSLRRFAELLVDRPGAQAARFWTAEDVRALADKVSFAVPADASAPSAVKDRTGSPPDAASAASSLASGLACRQVLAAAPLAPRPRTHTHLGDLRRGGGGPGLPAAQLLPQPRTALAQLRGKRRSASHHRRGLEGQSGQPPRPDRHAHALRRPMKHGSRVSSDFSSWPEGAYAGIRNVAAHADTPWAEHEAI